MNKKEAAEYLNVSTRLVERYASEGRLGDVKYVRGKTGKQADYDKDAVERLKFELESPDTALATNSQQTGLVMASQSAAIAELFKSILESANHKAEVSIADKLTLSLDEAAKLSGLSKNYLRNALHAKKLKGRIIGRGWRVKRADLEAYISKL